MSRQKIVELQDKRRQSIAAARQVLEASKGDNLTEEEQRQYDAHFKEAQGYKDQIENLTKLADAERDLSQSQGTQAANRDAGTGETGTDAEKRAAYEDAVRSFLTRQNLSDQQLRHLQIDSDPYGGYLKAPPMMVDRLIKEVDNLVYIRQWGTVFEADELGAVTLENDAEDAEWTKECKEVDDDESMSFGKRELKANPLAKSIVVSRTLIRRAPRISDIIADRFAYKFGVTEEKAFLTGNGSGQPLGVFVNSPSGITADRDFSTGNTPTGITFDGLIGAKYHLKSQYHAAARWLFFRETISAIAQLKDGDGQYLWRESVRAGEPDMLLGMPIFSSEYVPNTFVANAYVGILGDFSNYWIADPMIYELEVLRETKARQNKNEILARTALDGQPVLPDGFVRVQLASA